MSDSFATRDILRVNGTDYTIFSLARLGQRHDLSKLPYSMKILLENLLRCEDGVSVTRESIEAVATWDAKAEPSTEIAFMPARVVLQDFTGVPCVVDLAAMRDAVTKLGGDARNINPLIPSELVIDHSVQVDVFGKASALDENGQIEFARNGERYSFLRWGQKAVDNFKVVPPYSGIVHQVNVENLARVVMEREIGGVRYAFPDTVFGTDSHTTMINGIGVLGWGVGGIEAEAAMLGQPVSMLIPEVVGFKLTGKLREGITATDLVLTVTQMLRSKGVVGKFVEFYGDGLADLPLADRATIANMAPEYGATCGFFPVDAITLGYLRLSGRPESTVKLVEAYCKAQGLWREQGQEPWFSDQLTLDMGSVEASLAGPKRPQDRVALPRVKQTFDDFVGLHLKPTAKEEGRMLSEGGGGTAIGSDELCGEYEYQGQTHHLRNGAVVIAAITSCTNTSNPSVMMAAGLLAKKACEKGLQRKPWVKSSLAPGSKVVTDYFKAAGLTQYLDQLGFDLVGYGCTTCIGNSGPLLKPIEQAIQQHDLTVASVLSGNRNFEGRVHPLVKTNWLASPPLVVAYALAGSVRLDLSEDPLGVGKDGEPVYLRDIWPTQAEIAEAIQKVDTAMFHKEYAEVFAGDEHWQAIQVPHTDTYAWQADSTYIQHPPFFEAIAEAPPHIGDIHQARILALLGDSVTTDHISPAGNIKADSPAGRYLSEQGVAQQDFNSYGARRGNHHVMMRGTFANIRIRNEMLGGEEGGITLHVPSGEKLSIYDAAMRYQEQGTPLVVIAGKEYGTGSSRDWAAKGTNLLGIKAVLAESFERIHRSNLVGMGVLPLQFDPGQNRKTLGLSGKECINIYGLDGVEPHPQMKLMLEIIREDDSRENIEVLCRIDTLNEVEYFKAGGILHYVLRQLIEAS